MCVAGILSMVETGDKIKYPSQEREEMSVCRVDKILLEESTGVRYAYLSPMFSPPSKRLVPLDEVDERGQVLEDG